MPIRYFMMWAIGLMTAGPASAPAGNLIPGPLPIGLYDSLTSGASSVDEIAAINGNLTSAYWGTPSPGFSNVHDYLDAAQAEGVRVVVEIDPVRIANADVVGITEIVATFDSHPAVVGWYTADEPFWVQPVIPEPVLRTAYDTIKLNSSKPVVVTFSTPGLERNAAVQYINTFDIMMTNDYPFRLTGEPEFTGLDEVPGRCCGYPHNWKAAMQVANSQSKAVGKPWWSVMEGWSQAVGETSAYRFPTFDEARFMNYWSLKEDAAGLLHFAFYRAFGQSPAYPNAPYPKSGVHWLGDVYMPLAAEMNTLSPAIQGGKVTSAVNDNQADVEVDLYQDPSSGDYYLLAVNSTAGDENANISINLPQSVVAAQRVFEDDSWIGVHNGSFGDSFSQYEVHVYQLIIQSVPGDVTGEGLVNVSDIDALRTAIRTGDNSPRFNLNGDSVIDMGDLDHLVQTILETDYGDANLDSLINQSDTDTVRLNFSSTGEWSAGNFDTNLLIDAVDLSMIRRNTTLAPSAPEPLSLTILCLGTVMIAQRARTKERRIYLLAVRETSTLYP